MKIDSAISPHDPAPGFKPLLSPVGSAPTRWQGSHCIAVPAAPHLAALDHAAVMAGRQALEGLFGPGDPWPPATLTRAEDEADLAWHEREFRQGRSFAYSLLDREMQACLGCVYLYPTASPDHDGEAYLWTTVTRTQALRRAVAGEVTDWLERTWPFRALAWPGRTIPFSRWRFPNYYAEQRHLTAR